jgi:hypothetical protein
VHYERPDDLAPAAQVRLLNAVRDAARHAPVAPLFVVGPAIRIVSPDVPGFWLQQVEPLRIRALAVASQSFAVRIAANSFGVANRAIGRTLAVRAFPDERSAREWVREPEPAGAPLVP